jgi:hypothetical protein
MQNSKKMGIRELRSAGDTAMEIEYPMSSDWQLLKSILEKTPVFGLVDYRGMRDAVVVRKWTNGEYRVSVRGLGYFEEEWDQFVEEAEKYNLKFVLPESR